jgi:hypothetical protein
VDLLPEKAFTHHTHLKTEKNESIKRDERERIGHHADRTASVQVCVCFRTSVIFVLDRLLNEKKKKKRELHPHGEKNGSSFGKKKDFPPRGVPVRERNLSLSLSSTSTSSLLCALLEVMVPLIARLQAENDEEEGRFALHSFFLFPSSSPSTETFFISLVES